MINLITLSRELGSGGIDIAQKLAHRLNWKCIDKEVIIQVAKLAKCSEEQIEKFDQEQFDQMKVLFNDLAFPVPGSGMMYPFVAAGYMEPYWFPATVSDSEGMDETKYLKLTKTVLMNLANEGKVILVGRGGCVLLKDKPETLHIRIVAPMEERIQRVMKVSELDENSARELVKKRDKASSDYIKHFYNADWTDPMLYHLVINTGKLSPDETIDLIVSRISA